jgi:hypothetical protein
MRCDLSKLRFLLSRQEGRLQRLLDRSNKEIHFLTSQRPAAPQPVPQPESAAEPISAPVSATPAARSGFVPSNIAPTCRSSKENVKASIAAAGSAQTATKL